jgi:adenylate cyclase
MKIHFQQQLNEELLRSEKKRTIIIISIFLFMLVYRTLQGFFFEMDNETRVIQSIPVVWLFPLVVIVFEIATLFAINRQIRSKKNRISPVRQYVNTAVEICLPSFILITVARQFPSYDILRSPALLIYFVFIILSTMRLNFMLSFFCGILSGASHFVLCFFIYDHFDFNDAARTSIIIVSSIAAGLVANQIRRGINKSLKETEKRNKVENLFGQQISMEVAEKILENNGRIESKRMTVAIMFVDIRNFTNFAASRNPEEIVQYQNTFFAIVSNAVANNGGIVNQFLGDGCMVTFGAPVSIDNPSLNAVKAALEINQKLRAAVSSGKIVNTTIGIGIHTGSAITGNIGNDIRQQYSVTGKVVIVAARVEQLNKDFNSQILITNDVYKNAGLYLSPGTENLGSVSLKGFDENFIIHKVA